MTFANCSFCYLIFFCYRLAGHSASATAWNHGLIHFKDNNTECRYQNKLTCKKTLWHGFIRVYRLEIQSVMLVFSTQLCEMLSLSPSLSILYTCIQCVRGGGYGVLGLRQINTCRKAPLQVNFLDDDILHCLLWVLAVNEQEQWEKNQLDSSQSQT